MVKKKVKKKVQNVPRRGKSAVQIKKDMELFATGVERLKGLERELKSLDTRGFGKEEASIRGKLKNVSDIPIIERELKSLKLRIRGKYKPRRRHKSQVSKDVEVIKGEVPSIKRGLKQLSEKIEEVSKKKAVQVDSGVGFVVDSEFNNFLKNVKGKLSERVREKEKNVGAVLKKDLKIREDKFREKYDSLVNAFEARKKKMEEDLKKKKKEANMKLFERIKEKIKLEEANAKERAKLEKYRVGEREKYADLMKKLNEERNKIEEEINRKYALKVRDSLKKEVSSKFNKKVEKRLDAERVVLSNRYKSALRAHANDVLKSRKEELRKGLEAEYLKKGRDLESRFKSDMKRLHKESIAKGNSLRRRREEVNAKLKDEELKNERAIDVAKKELQKEKVRFAKRMAKRRTEDLESLNIARNKLEVEQSLARKRLALEKDAFAKHNKEEEEILELHKNNLNDAKKEFEAHKEEEKGKIRQELSEEFHNKLLNELSEREKIINSKLKNEYNLKLKNAIREHDEELRKKKLDLELEIQNKMKSVLQ